MVLEKSWKGNNVIRNWIMENGYRYARNENLVLLIKSHPWTSVYIETHKFLFLLTICSSTKDTSFWLFCLCNAECEFSNKSQLCKRVFFRRIPLKLQISSNSVYRVYIVRLERFNEKRSIKGVCRNSHCEHEFPIIFKISITLDYKMVSASSDCITIARYRLRYYAKWTAQLVIAHCTYNTHYVVAIVKLQMFMSFPYSVESKRKKKSHFAILIGKFIAEISISHSGVEEKRRTRLRQC